MEKYEFKITDEGKVGENFSTKRMRYLKGLIEMSDDSNLPKTEAVEAYLKDIKEEYAILRYFLDIALEDEGTQTA